MKCIGRKPFLAVLCWIVGIPVNQSSDKPGLTVPKSCLRYVKLKTHL